MDNATKKCTSCATEKRIDEFYRNRNFKDGRAYICKTCDKARLAERAAAIRAQPKKVPGSKVCPKCGEQLPASSFNRNRSRVDGLSHSCKECTRSQQREYMARNPAQAERNRERLRDIYKNDQERYLNYRYRNRFGITLARYEELFSSQGGGCAVCGRGECHGGVRLAVDHDHTCCPGKKSCGACVRGLLCADCNRAIGLLKDSSELAERAAKYLNT